MVYEIFLEFRAKADIQQAIDYYDFQQAGLGKRFLMELDGHFSSLSPNPFFRVRYDNVRCLPMRKFPFLIHFIVSKEEKAVYVISVFRASKNPDSLLKYTHCL